MKRSATIAIFISLGVFLLLAPIFLKLISYLHPIVLVVVFFCLFVVSFFLVVFIRKEVFILPYRLFAGLLFLYSLALLLLLFLRPNDQSYQSMNLVPFSTIFFYLSGKANWLVAFYNLAANIGLFVPYGFYLRVKNFSTIIRIGLPVITISTIEITQFLTHRGSLDIDDLILNLLGLFLGYLFYQVFRKVFRIEAAS